MPDDDLVSTPDAARRIGVSARTLQRYVREGHVRPAVTLPSGQYRWDVRELRAQLEVLTDRRS